MRLEWPITWEKHIKSLEAAWIVINSLKPDEVTKPSRGVVVEDEMGNLLRNPTLFADTFNTFLVEVAQSVQNHC